VRLDVGPGATLTLGDGVTIGAGTRFDVAGEAEVHVAAGTVLGRRCVIAARERVTVGERCRLGDEVVLMDFDHETADHERPVREQGLVTAAVAIGDDAVLDDTVVVLHGSTVGPGAHVTTRAVVTRDVAPGAVVGGVPARPGRLRI
jgi:acetyltransferase-like isoleucine patch superfamily enzyme